MRRYRSVGIAFSLIALSVSFSSCLKTRAQVKDDSDGPQAGRGQIKDVEPQGSYAIDELKGELTRLNGRIEDIERANQQGTTQANQANKEEQKKTEARLLALEQAQANMLAAIKQMQETQAIAADPQQAFEDAKSSFSSKNYEGAVEQLTVYLKSTKGKYTEEATYLRGESYFQMKQYQKAIVDFSKFPEKYSRSTYMPRCLLRIGQSFDALGMKEDAAGFYQELVEKYPKSSEAKKVHLKKSKASN